MYSPFERLHGSLERSNRCYRFRYSYKEWYKFWSQLEIEIVKGFRNCNLFKVIKTIDCLVLLVPAYKCWNPLCSLVPQFSIHAPRKAPVFSKVFKITIRESCSWDFTKLFPTSLGGQRYLEYLDNVLEGSCQKSSRCAKSSQGNFHSGKLRGRLRLYVAVERRKIRSHFLTYQRPRGFDLYIGEHKILLAFMCPTSNIFLLQEG